MVKPQYSETRMYKLYMIADDMSPTMEPRRNYAAKFSAKQKPKVSSIQNDARARMGYMIAVIGSVMISI